MGSFQHGEHIIPQEQPVLTVPLHRTFVLGIPRERRPGETRVALAPTSVKMLVQSGIKVRVEAGAGETANFRDIEYAEVGAEICDSAQEVWQADVVAKVLFPSVEEVDWFRRRQVVFSMLDLGRESRRVFVQMARKGMTAVAIDRIHTPGDFYPLMEVLGELGGELAIFVAAELLSNVHGGKGILLGGIAGAPPSEMLILGAGALGRSIARQAQAVGAEVKVFDDSVYRLRQLRHSLPLPVYTSTIHTDPLLKALETADVIVGAFHKSPEGLPYVVPTDFVRRIKEGSVIIDLNIEDGGAFATSRPTTHHDPIFIENGVIHYCVPNITARVAFTASIVLSNFYFPMLLKFGQSTSFNQYIMFHREVRAGTYLYEGIPTHPVLQRYWNIPVQNVDLLLSGWD